ncbi:MAG: sugar kinase [Candidatus Omnitrophica bacterium]|nr:sugar kinase [Candidatus Omnitrophota bacterium]
MSLLVIGSIALDSIRTPFGSANNILGGSATYAALAARLWGPVHVVGVVGTDFPSRYGRLLSSRGVNGSGLVRVPGKTFRWKGSYDEHHQATTEFLDLGVFAQFRPKLSDPLRRVETAFLGNIHPGLQADVLRQLTRPRITACDSRADWIRGQRRSFLRLLTKVTMVFLNDSEAKLLTGVSSLVEATKALCRLGPAVAVVKKGEHGVLAASREAFFSLPGYPVSRVKDPTGAGDAFAGAALGYLATRKRLTWPALCQAVEFGSVTASLVIESFGTSRLAHSSLRDVLARRRAFQSLGKSIAL